MCSILDIDLDYFNLMDDPVQRLRRLLAWAERPADIFVERHHQVLRRWKARIKKGTMAPPTYVLHVDEHHDMMDEKLQPNIANVAYHVMREWPECQMHWLVEEFIDSPSMWLSEETWRSLGPRFSMGPRRPRSWPRPDLVSICTSPEFVSPDLRRRLCAELGKKGRVIAMNGAGRDGP